VVDALGEIGDAKALDALTRALKDDDAGVRRHAAAAIAEVSGNGTGPRPHPHPHPHPHPLPVRAGVR
jgi:HEAT repeat protein